jgi:hypothetical protein
MASVYDIAAVKVVGCPHCNQPVGRLCLNNSGRETNCCHFRRKEALQQWRKQGNDDKYRMLIKGEEYGSSEC